MRPHSHGAPTPPSLAVSDIVRSPATLLITCIAGLLVWLPAPSDGADYQALLTQAREAARGRDFPGIVAAYELAAQAATGNQGRARAWFELAGHLDRADQRTGAIRYLEKTAALEPATNWRRPCLERLAHLYRRMGKLKEAVGAYERLGKMAGDDPGLAEMGLWGQANVYRQMGDPQKAAEVARRLLADHPDGRYATFATGVLIDESVRRREFQRAAELARREAKRENGDAGALLTVASRMQAAGALDKALALAQEYVGLRPDSAGAYHIVYNLHEQRGSLDEYEAQLNEGANATDAKPGDLRRLADLYERRGKFAQALDVLARLLDRAPTDAAVAASAGRMAMRAGRPRAALPYYERAVRLQPDNLRLLNEFGGIYAQIGDKLRALELWQKACRYDPADVASARALGRQLHARGYYQDAAQVYLASRQATGDAAVLATDLAQEYEALLQIDKAVAEYLVAMRAQPGAGGIAGARLRLLSSDKAAGPEVVAALQQHQQSGDLPGRALIALGLAYLASGRRDDASRVLEGIASSPELGPDLVQLGAELEYAGDRRGALAAYDALRKGALAPDMTAVMILRHSALLSQMGRWREAAEVLRGAPARGVSPDLANQVGLALADILVLQAADAEGAAELYVAVLTDSTIPEHRQAAAWGLADCSFAAGKYDDARLAYGELMDMEPPPQGPPAPPFAVIEGLVALPRPDSPAPGRPAGRAYGAYRLAEIELRLGRTEQAARLFEQMAQDYPSSNYANDALSRRLLISSKFTGESPAEPKYIEALGLIDRGQANKADRLLDMISSLGPEEPLADAAALLRADARARFGAPLRAAELYVKLATRFPQSPLAPEGLLRAGRLAAGREGGREEALKLLRLVLTQYADSPEAAQAELEIEELLRGR